MGEALGETGYGQLERRGSGRLFLSLRSSLGMKKFFAIAVLASSGEHGSQETFLIPCSPPPSPSLFLETWTPMLWVPVLYHWEAGPSSLWASPLPCQASSCPLGAV